MLVSSVRQYSAGMEADRVSHELLSYRAKTAFAAFQRKKDSVENAWNGSRKFAIVRKVPEIEGVHSNSGSKLDNEGGYTYGRFIRVYHDPQNYTDRG